MSQEKDIFFLGLCLKSFRVEAPFFPNKPLETSQGGRAVGKESCFPKTASSQNSNAPNCEALSNCSGQGSP